MLLARWKSPFIWPSLNKALYCGIGEVAASKTKWTSQLDRGGVGSWDHAQHS